MSAPSPAIAAGGAATCLLLLTGAIVASPTAAQASEPAPPQASAARPAQVSLLVPLQSGQELEQVLSLAPNAQLITVAGRTYVLIGAYGDARVAYRLGRSLQRRNHLAFELAYPAGHPQADGRWLQQEQEAVAHAPAPTSTPIANAAPAEASATAAAPPAARRLPANTVGNPIADPVAVAPGAPAQQPAPAGPAAQPAPAGSAAAMRADPAPERADTQGPQPPAAAPAQTGAATPAGALSGGQGYDTLLAEALRTMHGVPLERDPQTGRGSIDQPPAAADTGREPGRRWPALATRPVHQPTAVRADAATAIPAAPGSHAPDNAHVLPLDQVLADLLNRLRGLPADAPAGPRRTDQIEVAWAPLHTPPRQTRRIPRRDSLSHQPSTVRRPRAARGGGQRSAAMARLEGLARNPSLHYLVVTLPSTDALTGLQHHAAVQECAELGGGQLLARVGVYTESATGQRMRQQQADQLTGIGYTVATIKPAA